VTRIFASRDNVYSLSPLDRIHTRRDDHAWIAEKLDHPETLFVPVWRSRNLVRGSEPGAVPEAVYVDGDIAVALRATGGNWAFLGMLDDKAVFGIDISHHEDTAPIVPADLGTFTDLRSVGWGEPRPEASVLAHARGLLHWRTRHQFCGICGGKCESKSSGHVMHCTSCKTDHFPRTDPAVIMLVHRGDKALLGHSTRFPRGTMYSTLAGFVEPGETLEEAVRREVLEESAVVCGDVHYHSSQPWPFPGNVMLGFYAEGLTEEIVFDTEELKDARWFSRDEMRNCDKHGFQLPRSDSIARRLIEDWLAAG
jgi:NAD+ diphosphatase